MTRRALCEFIFSLLYQNIYARDNHQLNKALENRFHGFRAELDFAAYLRRHNRPFLSGGFFIPRISGTATLSEPVYFTVDSSDETNFSTIYSSISKLSPSKLLFLRFDKKNCDDWLKEDVMESKELLPVPEFKLLQFQQESFTPFVEGFSGLLRLFSKRHSRPKQSLPLSGVVKESCVSLISEFEVDDLLQLYVSRLVFDGFIGFGYNKGIPSDIDLIINFKKNKNDLDRWVFTEVKEKYPTKEEPVAFGIDVQRLRDCLQIANATEFEYLFVVRHVSDRASKEFVGWKYISFAQFGQETRNSEVTEGRSSMNTLSNNNPTFILPVSRFREWE